MPNPDQLDLPIPNADEASALAASCGDENINIMKADLKDSGERREEMTE